MARKPVLVQVDVEQLARLDRYAAAEFAGNRSRAIAEAVEHLLATHAARAAALRRTEAPRGGWLPAPRRSPDTTIEAGSRPLTADLR